MHRFEVRFPYQFKLCGPYSLLTAREARAAWDTVREDGAIVDAFVEVMRAMDLLNEASEDMFRRLESRASTPRAMGLLNEASENMFRRADSRSDEGDIYAEPARGRASSMRLHHGPSRVALELPRGRRVSAESVIERMQRRQEPKWIEVAGRFLRLRSEPEVWLACEIVVTEHNAEVGDDAADESDDEAVTEETAEIEAQVRARLEADTTEEEDERDRPPTPSQDMLYEREVYL
jgi:hypothetical protein